MSDFYKTKITIRVLLSQLNIEPNDNYPSFINVHGRSKSDGPIAGAYFHESLLPQVKNVVSKGSNPEAMTISGKLSKKEIQIPSFVFAKMFRTMIKQNDQIIALLSQQFGGPNNNRPKTKHAESDNEDSKDIELPDELKEALEHLDNDMDFFEDE